ncbi:hypothetical protein HMPREF1987_00948, partial [Peptostreptococcaceae bacterium oral taxon 113 str. W5053]
RSVHNMHYHKDNLSWKRIELKYLAKCKSGILSSLVGMKQYILKFISIEISLFKSFHSQVHIMAIRDIPADDFP